jgi:hypothetical protein
MQSQETSNAATPSAGLRAQKAVARDRGVSGVTMWRGARKGWYRVVNICGKPYIDMASLAEFDRRAAAGEFSKKPHGAALKSAEARSKKEKQEGGKQ